MFQDGFNFTCENQICWATIGLNAKIYFNENCLLKYRQHSDSSTAEVSDERRAVADWYLFLTWLETYLAEKGVDDPEVLETVKASREEIVSRRKFAPILNVYRKLLPIRTRYRIRDWILRTGT